jgi:hypothetical protein
VNEQAEQWLSSHNWQTGMVYSLLAVAVVLGVLLAVQTHKKRKLQKLVKKPKQTMTVDEWQRNLSFNRVIVKV